MEAPRDYIYRVINFIFYSIEDPILKRPSIFSDGYNIVHIFSFRAL